MAADRQDPPFIPAAVSDTDALLFAHLGAHVSWYWEILHRDWGIPEALAGELVRDWHQTFLENLHREP